MKTLHPSLRAGFTLIEMLVIAPIVILAIGAFITVIISMTGEVLASRSSSILAYNVQDAMNRIEQDVKLSTTYLSTNNITLTAGEQQGYNDDATNFTNVGGASGTSIILNELVTNGNPLSISSGIVYLTNTPNACASSLVQTNTPMTMNVIYFLKNNTLWRRTVMPSNYNAGSTISCSTPWQQPSCATNYTSPLCKTNDIRLVDNVSTFSVQYFNTANATSPNTTASDTSVSTANRNTALQSLPTISVSVIAQQNVAGRSVERSAVLRASRLDTNASTIASNIVTAPTAPSGVTTIYNNIPGQILTSWNPNATSYNLQYDTTSAFSSPTTISNITTANQTVTGLNSSPLYYFRVQSVNSAGTSGWSTTTSAYSTITNGLVGWYMLNGDANTATGSVNGTASNTGSVTGQNGTANNALSFNGTTSAISIPSTFSLGNTNVTLSCWVYNPSASNHGMFIHPGSNTGYGVGIGNSSTDTNGSKLVMLYETVRWIPTSATIGTGWHHIVMTIDGSSVPTGYVDSVSTGPYSGGSALVPNNNISAIGSIPNLTTHTFTGSIDDVRIYNRLLSGSEISQLYANGAR